MVDKKTTLTKQKMVDNKSYETDTFYTDNNLIKMVELS